MLQIENLTRRQRELLPVYRDRWLNIALSTEAADRDAAEHGVRETYKAAGLSPPKKMVWAGSPPEGAREARASASKYGETITWTLFEEIRREARNAFDQRASAKLRGHLFQQMGEVIWSRAWDRVRRRILDEAGEWPGLGSLFGQHDAHRLVTIDYARRELGIEECGIMSGPCRIAQGAGWWWPFRGRAIISERPAFIALDDRNRLHNADGPALEYSDGWKIYAWHGVRVGPDLIERPKAITLHDFYNERNTEVRRVMMERYGLKRFLEDTKAKVVHEDSRGTLFQVDIPFDEPLAMVKVKNSSPEPDGSFKDYYLRVPPGMKSASQAVAWTFGLDKEAYRPRAET